ncbi:probable transcription factor KAN2 isoform X4 [Prunus avium]|uniref:Probable transcription factor KAN2 isoform X4 n=1 Tax=Prunus avium TaxID=42229 RepID=A0A6P5T0Q4_PRUAV|nr:probable transcription factor KAN2 isoform X4 [Prunus avium]XP_021819777.1 probable transcription factor KAN2 isoform X4 [Prunus avium]
MDVKNFTLAHVRSHLQIYRTVFTANRAGAFSGQSDVHENASSGDATEDIIFYLQNPRSGDQLSSAQTIHVQDNKDSLGNFFKIRRFPLARTSTNHGYCLAATHSYPS